MQKTASEQKAQERFIVMPGINRFSERLRIAMNDMPNVELARKSGVSESAIRSYLKGASFPSIDKIEAIALACNAPMEWLITGEKIVKYSESGVGYDEADIAFIMRNLTEEQRSSLVRAILEFGVTGILNALSDMGMLTEFSLLPNSEKERLVRLYDQIKKGASEGGEVASEDSLASERKRAV